MEIPSIIIGTVLLGVAVGLVIRPFQGKRRKGTRTANTQTKPAERREAVFSAIRDLDFDFKTGKVSEEDYTPLRAQLLVEAAQVIEAIKLDDDKLESLIQARRAAQQKNKCDQCGALVEVGENFCAKCGSAVSHESCSHCGKKIHSGDLFCTSCGTRLEARTEPGRSDRAEAAA